MYRLPDPKTLFRNVDISMPVVVAVSGGSDSIALLLLAVAWARHNNVSLQIATVDHGLRPEAAAEAAFVASLCESLDVFHVTLAWEGIKPVNGISEAARNARYRLLEEFAGDVGADTILVGHTADDQAETIAMRLKRNGGSASGRGLSGMAPVTRLRDNVILIRPLLGLSRQMLRDYLLEHNQSWIEDPSNFDASYERVNIRLELKSRPDHAANLVDFGRVMGRYRRMLSNRAAEFLEENLGVSCGLVYSLPTSKLAIQPRPVVTLALQTVMALAGGRPHLVPADSVDTLLGELKSNQLDDKQSKLTRTTLGNAVIERKEGLLRFYRETRNLPAILLGPGDNIVWDGRLEIENKTSSSLFCGPLDLGHLQELETSLGKKLDVSPRSALRSTPMLRGDEDEFFLPFVKSESVPNEIILRQRVPALEHFCPAFDLPLLDWLHDFQEQNGLTSIMGQRSG